MTESRKNGNQSEVLNDERTGRRRAVRRTAATALAAVLAVSPAAAAHAQSPESVRSAETTTEDTTAIEDLFRQLIERILKEESDKRAARQPEHERTPGQEDTLPEPPTAGDDEAAPSNPEREQTTDNIVDLIPDALQPEVETDPVGNKAKGDVSDDPAIIVDRKNPENTVIASGIKDEKYGGIALFDTQGKLLQFIEDGQIGNVDVREGVQLGGREITLVAANNRTSSDVSLWEYDYEARQLTPVEGGNTDTGPNYGGCLGMDPETGKPYFFATTNEGPVKQLELVDNGNGAFDTELKRTIEINSTTEACVIDDDKGDGFFGEEAGGIHTTDLDPQSPAETTLIDEVGGGTLTADVEGLAIIDNPDGSRTLAVSNQKQSKIEFYNPDTKEHLQTTEVVASGDIDEVTETDGLDVTTENAGPGFENGMIVVHDHIKGDDPNEQTNLKIVPLPGGGSVPDTGGNDTDKIAEQFPEDPAAATEESEKVPADDDDRTADGTERNRSDKNKSKGQQKRAGANR